MQRKHIFRKMEGKRIKIAQAFVFQNLERKWLCSSWKRFVLVVARRLTKLEIWGLGFFNNTVV